MEELSAPVRGDGGFGSTGNTVCGARDGRATDYEGPQLRPKSALRRPDLYQPRRRLTDDDADLYEDESREEGEISDDDSLPPLECEDSDYEPPATEDNSFIDDNDDEDDDDDDDDDVANGDDGEGSSKAGRARRDTGDSDLRLRVQAASKILERGAILRTNTRTIATHSGGETVETGMKYDVRMTGTLTIKRRSGKSERHRRGDDTVRRGPLERVEEEVEQRLAI